MTAMIRQIDYRLATNAFVFTGLWFVIGAIVLWSPVPGALGIGGGMFAAWIVLFFLILAGAGSLLTIASLNTIFPPHEQAPPASPARASQPAPSSSTLWAPNAPGAPTTSGNAQHDG
jgi:hypothetical protein